MIKSAIKLNKSEENKKIEKLSAALNVLVLR